MLNARTLRSTQLLTLSFAGIAGGADARRAQAQRQAAAAAGGDRRRAENAGKRSAGQHGEAPIYGYVWLSMELAQQRKSWGSARVCTLARIGVRS